jgi:beta-N-acetylhexosaminidase
MLDIDGLALSPADRDLLREPAVGGVILFSRNFESVAQVTELVSEIRALRSPPLLVAVDHEGGRVQRFREGFTVMRAAGIDLCFAPCVDLDWGISEIIGNRAFHRKPDAVSELAEAFARGLRSAGMAAVAKHFPGHGAVVADSHLKLPVDRREYGLILDDMRPYERMMNTSVVAGVMLAHIVYSEIDSMPAGFSEYWIQRELRSRLGFGGAVFCDDLSMKATASYGRMAKRARLALDAGCDMILVCNDRDAAHQAVESLKNYSNPLSLVRLARLHGTGHPTRKTLLASDDWQEVNALFASWSERPELRLDA